MVDRWCAWICTLSDRYVPPPGGDGLFRVFSYFESVLLPRADSAVSSCLTALILRLELGHVKDATPL